MFNLLYHIILLICTGVMAQTGPPALTPGKVTEVVKARSGAGQSYALYLPSSYAQGGVHPVLFLMDPRGRALLPLGLFRDAAERRGYVVLSSYNTLSDADSAFAVNGRALNAMLVDAQVRFRADPSRFYLVGFSGTAHYALAAAPQLDGHLAGIVGVGGGLTVSNVSVQEALKMRRPLAYFGIAGTGDFNYDGARLLDRGLDTTYVQHRFHVFEGRHSWPPKEVAEAAIDWLELQAMRAGLAARKESWMDSVCTVYLAEARALEDKGMLVDAMRRYREVAADCGEQAVANIATARMESLAHNPKVRKAQDRRDKLARRYFEYRRMTSKFMQKYRSSKKEISHDKSVRRLKIGSLAQEAADTTDYDRANAAKRMLATAYADLAFYEPRAYMQSGDFKRAVGMLRLAEEIWPNAPFACYWLAQAFAQLGQTEEALKALACALQGGWLDRKTVEQNSNLMPLHDQSRFSQLLDSTETELQKKQ